MATVYRLESKVETTTTATKKFFSKVELFTAHNAEGGKIFFKDINSSESLITSLAEVKRFMPNYAIVQTQNSIIPIWKITEPQYRGTGEHRILCSATYKGYTYYVVDGPMNPCCYIDLADTYWSGHYNNIPCDVHGGITYSPADGYELSFSKGELIGWDYGHFDDYIAFSDGRCIGTKKYTTYELIRDCQKAIDDLERIEDEETLAYCCD